MGTLSIGVGSYNTPSLRPGLTRSSGDVALFIFQMRRCQTEFGGGVTGSTPEIRVAHFFLGGFLLSTLATRANHHVVRLPVRR